jgi:toxin ParE1/3/4
MRLKWSAYALADRIAIFDYIEADSPQAAVAVDERIREQVEVLARFPQSGRTGRIEGTRELTLAERPTLSPIASQAILSGSCVCCTELAVGRTICPKSCKSK